MRRLSLLITALLALAGSVFADDKLQVTDFTIVPGKIAFADIVLSNPDAQYSAIQADLYLPEGLDIETEGEEYKYELSRVAESHSLSIGKMNGYFRLVLASTKSEELSGNSGKVISLSIKASSDLTTGTLEGSLKNIKLAKKDGTGQTIDKAVFKVIVTTIDVTAPSAKTDLVYTGKAQNLITAGSTSLGEMHYSIDGTTYSAIIPTGTDAKEYTVYYKVVAETDLTEPISLKVNISPKTVNSPTITLSETSYTYDGTAKEPTVTVKDGETTIPASEYTVSYKNNTNVGTATVTITDVEGGNYTVSGSTTFSIASADGSLVPPTGISGLIYTGSAQDLITAGSSTTGTIQYSLDGETYGTAIPQGTDTKEYTVYYKVVASTGYNDIAPVSFKVTIAPKTICSPTITLSETSYPYDGTEKKPTVTAVKDGETTIPDSEYTVSYKDNINVGTATVTITDVEGGNYIVSGTTTFSIVAPDEPDNPDNPNTPDTPDTPDNPDEPATPVVNKEEAVSVDDQTFYEMTEEAKEATKETIKADLALSPEVAAVASVSDDGKMSFTQNTQDADIAILDAKKGEVLTVSFDGQMVGKKSQLKKLDSPAATRGDGNNDEFELVSGAGYEVLEDGDIVLTLKLEEAPVEIESITLVTPEPESEPTETYGITIGKNGKTTFCGDMGLDFSGTDEVKAFIATGFDKAEGTIWMTRVKDVPAGVPVMVKGDANTTYEIPVTDGGTSYYKNMFVGNTSGGTVSIGTKSEDGKYDNYYLSSGQFKSVNGSANIGNNKCYLQLPAEFEAETTGEALSVMIAASGKSTFAAPYDLDFTDFGDDLKAFTATGFDKSTSTIWLTRVKKVQKGEGLMLKGTGGETYTIPSTGAQAAYENMIVGNTSGETIEIGETDEDGTLTNYYLKGGTYMKVVGSANIGNNKSYLQLPTYMLAGARSEDASDMQNEYSFAELETESMPLILGSIGGDDGDTTGIRTTDCTDYTDESRAVWYDVQGRKYDGKPTKKGLYIHHGRKVVIK